MKRHFRWMLLLPLVAAGMMVTACSSNDDNIMVNYCMANKDGQVTSVFKNGDEMRFLLTIQNNSDHPIKGREDDIIKSAFNVFSKDGQYIGYAKKTTEERIDYISIEPGKQESRGSRWEYDPLPSGEYFSICELQLNGQIRSYKTYFKVE